MEGLQCIDDFTVKCLDKEHRAYFNTLYAGTTQVIVDLCQAGSYQSGIKLSSSLKIYYSQNHVKCSRPLCSLPGLQGQTIFADAIIKILIPTKYISDKNCYDQLFINKVVLFTFQFDESVTKFYVVKVLLILMKFS